MRGERIAQVMMKWRLPGSRDQIQIELALLTSSVRKLKLKLKCILTKTWWGQGRNANNSKPCKMCVKKEWPHDPSVVLYNAY